MIEIETENKTISSCLTFHNTEFPPSLLQEMYTPPSPIEREHFGVLEINIPKEKISNDVIWDIVFSIDNSGSMSDFCSDNKSKMEHIKHTLRNILKLFSTNKEIHALSTPQSSTEFIRTTTPIKGSSVLQFNVYVQTFNDEIKEIFDFTTVTEENADELIQKINAIYEQSSTNLRLPLEKSRIKIKERQKNYPKHQIIHIELTDGDDTCGNSLTILRENMCNDYKNIFIGFGKEHNSILLDTLANNNKNEYRFIDKIESAGLVYGEIIHNLMYMKYPEVEIKINGGKIYNWRTNEWVNNMFIGSLASGLIKTFHIQSDTPYDVVGVLIDSRYKQENITNETLLSHSSTQEFIASVPPTQVPTLHCFQSTLHDTDLDYKSIICEFSTLPNLLDEDSNIILIDHTKYMYRQRTQELLYESKMCYSKKWKKDKKREFKKKLKSFFDNMKEYIKGMSLENDGAGGGADCMSRNRLENDIFWKVLLDDVYIAYKTIDSQYSYLYTNSRQTSQGMQQTYAVNNLEGLHLDEMEDIESEDIELNISDDDILNKTIRNCFPIKNKYFQGNEGCCPPSSPKNKIKHEMLDNTQSSYSNNEMLDLMKTINSRK